ncbi:MAG TPA: tetratricopeptide repeat protein, partial [Longimicrobium sp.]|nr:tetratricopeptide repeat protein [Longimicrobium sp.]
TQAAARLAPESPRLAYAVGRLARDRGEYARAESWLRTSIRLARRTDWHTYALAYLSLGTLYQHLGNYPAARIVNLRGFRTAVRRRIRTLEGVALHNLFAIATEMLDFKRGHEYARAAFQCYGPAHPRFPALVNDVGCFWILHGCFGRAAAVLEGVLPRFQEPSDRMLALANLARAAAAAGRHNLYESSYSECLVLLPQATTPERAAQVWMNLARASASAGNHPRAEAAAEAAIELATALRLGHMRLELEALLDAITAARKAGEALVTYAPGELDPVGEALAEDILRMLAEPFANGAGAV